MVVCGPQVRLRRSEDCDDKRPRLIGPVFQRRIPWNALFNLALDHTFTRWVGLLEGMHTLSKSPEAIQYGAASLFRSATQVRESVKLESHQVSRTISLTSVSKAAKNESSSKFYVIPTVTRLMHPTKSLPVMQRCFTCVLIADPFSPAKIIGEDSTVLTEIDSRPRALQPAQNQAAAFAVSKEGQLAKHGHPVDACVGACPHEALLRDEEVRLALEGNTLEKTRVSWELLARDS
eukprot:scaffold31_cov263-Pinguiococcus_pyrenoidosus.AAC.40